jgi:hypothetical protein
MKNGLRVMRDLRKQENIENIRSYLEKSYLLKILIALQRMTSKRFAKIGILSDTLYDIDNVNEAIYRFKEQKIEFIIHAGNFVFLGIIDEFKISQNENWHPKLVGVLGNNDGEKLILSKTFMKWEVN